METGRKKKIQKRLVHTEWSTVK